MMILPLWCLFASLTICFAACVLQTYLGDYDCTSHTTKSLLVWRSLTQLVPPSGEMNISCLLCTALKIHVYILDLKQFFFSFNLFNRSVNHWPLLTASQVTLNCVVSNTLCCEMSGAVLQVKLCIPRPFNRSASTVCKWKAVYLSCQTAFHSNIIGHGSHQHLTMELWQ